MIIGVNNIKSVEDLFLQRFFYVLDRPIYIVQILK